MKLDEGLADQKLALDITPLIDIVFLLVLFFAVTTSFISPEKLDEMKGDLVSLSDDKEQLGQQLTGLQADLARTVAEKQAEISGLLKNIDSEQGKTEKLRWMMAALEKDKANIEKSLSDSSQENESLESQLEKAYDDFKLLNVKVKTMEDEAAQAAAEDALLQSLLAERLAELQAKQQESVQLSSRLSAAGNRQAETERQLASSHQKLAATSEELARTGQVLAAANQELSTTSQRLAATDAELSQTRQRLAGTDSRLSEANQKTASLASQIAMLTGNVQGLESQMAALNTEVDEKALRQKMLQALLEEKAGENSSLSEQLARATAQYEQTSGELENTKKSQADVSARADTLRSTILRLESELAKYRKVADLDREQIEKVLQAQENLQQGLGSYLESNQLGIKRDQQRLTVQLSDKILFASGSANIKAEGLQVLRTVGEILKARIGELDVQIAGHTDNIPVAGKAGPLGSNWGLSAARAVNVVRFFEDELGLDPDRLSAIGFGEFRPIADNGTAQGRASNRRIEIVLVPRA